MPETRQCIYCSKFKSNSDFSEEHIIPQFMGGSSDCADVTTGDVCQQCNSLFGRYVDASVAKGFFQNSIERNSWESCFDYDPQQGNTFPLIYFGKNSDLRLKENEEAELWLAPEGGTIWHIHEKHPDDFDAFAGGDPVQRRKDVSSRVYVFFASETPYWIHSNCKSAISHFDREPIFLGADSNIEDQLPPQRLKGRLCKKDPEALLERDAIRTILNTGKPLSNRVQMDLLFDVRFLAKLAIGFGHKLFGEDFRGLQYTAALRDLLWTRRSNLNAAQSKVKARTYFSGLQDMTLKMLSTAPGFVFAIKAVGKDVVLVVLFPSGHFIQVTITDTAIDPEFNAVGRLKEERAFVAFPQLKKTIGPFNFIHFTAWKLSKFPIAALDDVLKRLTPRTVMPPLK